LFQKLEVEITEVNRKKGNSQNPKARKPALSQKPKNCSSNKQALKEMTLMRAAHLKVQLHTSIGNYFQSSFTA